MTPKPDAASAATIHPWQRPLLDLFDRLRAAGPGAKLKLVVGRKRSRLIVVDRDGKEIE